MISLNAHSRFSPAGKIFEMPSLSIIIPLYNERELIEPVYHKIKKAAEALPIKTEILFVNDGSKDNPEEIFKKFGIPFVSHTINSGYGKAFRVCKRLSDGAWCEKC